MNVAQDALMAIAHMDVFTREGEEPAHEVMRKVALRALSAISAPEGLAGGRTLRDQYGRFVSQQDLEAIFARMTAELEDIQAQRDALACAAPQPPLPSGAPDALAVGVLVEIEALEGTAAKVRNGASGDRVAAWIEMSVRGLRAAIAQAEAGTSGTSERLDGGRPLPFDRDTVEAMREALRMSRPAVASKVATYRPWVEKIPGRVNPWQAVIDAVDAALAQPQGAGPTAELKALIPDDPIERRHIYGAPPSKGDH